MKLLIFAASHRKESLNRKLAMLAKKHAESQGISVDFAEYADFDMPLYDDAFCDAHGVPEVAQSFAKRAASADGIIISTPEYNWSYPGSLKNIIDWTSCLKENPLAGKTALLMSATPGARGGILGMSHMKTVLESMQMFVYPKSFALGMADTAFGSNGELVKQQEALNSLISSYIGFTRKLA